MDIIEIALDYYTDFKKFERLATEIMSLEGFGAITPVGGIDDEGVDAEIVRYYKDEIQRTVFQFTIQENITAKISDTIKKLKENNIEFQQLIIVTKNQINNTQKHKRDARIKHQVNLEIFEKSIFIKHLSTENGLLLRYFPNLKAQLNSSLFDKKSIFSDSSSSILEESLLKCSLLFTFNPESERARKDIFDHTILGIIVSQKQSISKEKIIELFINKFDKEINISELDSTLLRLKKEGYVLIDDNNVTPTKLSIEKISGSLSKINSSTQALIDDIVSNIKDFAEERIDTKTETLITNNIKKSLSAYFRLYGLEYSDGSSMSAPRQGFEGNTDLIALAKSGLSNSIAEQVVFSIGKILKSPTENQIETLANWARAFIGLQVMGLDSKLSNFQATRISQKTFIIDTDFLLYCIVPDCKTSELYLKTINELHKLRCRIIIPDEVIYEAIKHAEFAYRSFNYFKNTFGTVDPIIVEEKIGNIYVKGYYNSILKGNIDASETSFRRYLENFYDKESPFSFLKELIQNIFSNKVTIGEITSLLNTPIPPEKLEELINLLYDETKSSVKGGYRTEEENREVATTDAKLFLTAYYLNPSNSKNNNEILSGNYYLITSSSRTLRVARKIGLDANVIAKPNTLVNLLEKIGQFSPTSSEIINLFENPYLVEAANNSWDTIKVLTEAGVSLQGKNVVRLRWDLDGEIKSFISNQNKLEESTSASESEKVDDYISFIRQVKSKGYKLVPDVELLEKKVTELETEVRQNNEAQEELQSEIEKFGKRRQQYFERIKNKTGNRKK